MATHLPQNQFISNSADVPTADEADAPTAPLRDASAALSDGALLRSLPSGEIELPVMPADAPSGTEAAVVNGSPTTAAASDIMHIEHNAITQAIEVRPHNELEQLIGVAGKRRRLKLPKFVPDYEGMEAAINDPGSPRLRGDDPIWTDASPLFLREA